MVVLASAILSKSGHVLVSRQFVSIARTRIEGLLVAFPKLIGTDSQHTFVETDSVRYVYQPLEQLYLVLITNKQSNIMEDLETLKLLSKIIPEYAEGYTEASIKTAAFDLIFAFDEVLTLGHKEPITLQQVKTFLEMDSHEERLYNIIQTSKMDEAKEAMRRKAEQIAREKEELRNQTSLPRGGGSSYSSYSSSYSSSSSLGSHRTGGGGIDEEDEEEAGSKIEEEPAPKPTPKASSVKSPSEGGPKRMVLGKGKKTEDEFVAALVQEDKLVVSPRTASSAAKVDDDKDEETATAVAEHNHPVTVAIDEKLSLTLDREGGVKSLEVSGEMKLSIYDPDWTKIILSTNGPLKKSDGYRCRLHPKINDKLYDSKGLLGLKEAGRGFPSGSDNAPIILRWKLQSKDEKFVPFTINFWPNSEDGKSMVNVQVEHQKEGVTFRNVHLSIPCPSKEPPEVGDHEGDFLYDNKKKNFNLDYS